MKIGIDLDGCVYDYVGALRHYFAATSGVDPASVPPVTQWEIWACWGITEREFWQLAADAITEGEVFLSGDACPGAIEALFDLVERGHELHVVTARRRELDAISQTIYWLQQWNVPFKSISFSSDKTLLQLDAFVEDNLDNAKAIDAADGFAILLDRPWNADPFFVGRAADWADVVRIVDHISEDQ